MEVIKWMTLATLIVFTGYTIYVTKTENFFKSCKAVFALKWGRQLTIDLYIGLFLFNFFVYLNEGSILVMLCWLVPTLILGNLVTLLYFFLNIESIVSHFLSV